jgi:WD40 repeat protein/serine/threonine protein kinase
VRGREIFFEALELATPEARSAYLRAACGPDVALRREVEELLKEHDSDDSLLAGPAIAGERPGVPEESREGPACPEPAEGARVIGRYKLLEQIGDGGFGEVWMAEQSQPVKRRVALKLIRPGMDSRQIVSRFEAERQALAMMDHPNIARIFDADVTDTGRPYFVMELVCGTKITEFCDQNHLPTHERLKLFILVCQAIQHAHQKGIIHRDIKPSNILVTLHDGVPVPKVIDFGIAKATQQELTDKTVFTQFLQFVGTPAYVSPEQAETSGLDIDTRADIYSLGVLLYELLVGQTPFDAQEMMQGGLDALRQIIREREPLRPSTRLNTLKRDARTTVSKRRQTEAAKLVQQLQGDLDWIVMKCLEKDRTRRYETANSLALDIQRHLTNEPVSARPPSAAYKFQKAWRRNRMEFSALGAVICALLLGVVASVWQAVRATVAEKAQKASAESARINRDVAVAAQQREAQAREETRQLLYTSDMERAQHAWEANNVGLVLELLERHKDRKRPGDFEWYYLWRLCKRSLLTPTIQTDSPALAVALSSDGRTLACGEMGGSVSLISTRTRQKRKLGAHASQVFCVVFSPGGTMLASASGDSTIRLWDVEAEPQVQRAADYTEITGFTDWVTSVDFDPDGKFLAVGSLDGQVGLWNVAKRKFEWRSADSRYVQAVAISPDGTTVASANLGFQAAGVPAGIKLRDAVTGQVLYHQSAVEADRISFAPDGSSLATSGGDGVVRLWDRKLKAIDELPGQTFPSLYLDSNTAAGISDNTVRIWDLATRTLRDTLYGHSGAVQSLACSLDGKLLVSASLDHTVKLWQLDGQSETSVLYGHNSSLWAVALSPDGSTVASGSVDRTVKLWDLATGKRKFDLLGHSDDVTCVAYAPDGRTLASGGDDREIILWDTSTGKETRRFKGHTNTVWSLAFLEGGDTLASTGEDGTVRLWSLATGEGRVMVKRPKKFSCLTVWQGQVLAFADWEEYVVEVWDLHDRGKRRGLRGHLGPVRAMAFIRTGRELVTGSRDGTVRLWDLEANGPSEILTRHTDGIEALAVSPDGATLACGGGDGTVKLMDLSTRRERIALKRHAGPVWSLVFSRDGKVLVSGGDDKTVMLWRAASDEEVAGATVSTIPAR